MDFFSFITLAMALGAIAMVMTSWHRTGTPRHGRPIFRSDDGKLFLYEERAGYRSVAQDWWREVVLVPGDRIKYAGAWFKFNVGYPPKAQADTSPFALLPEQEVRRVQAQLPAA